MSRSLHTGDSRQRLRPGATYRLQFNSNFRFADATRLVLYLRQLGITHCYASPVFQAVPGSTHGYDVCNFGQINSEIGSVYDFERFLSALRESGIELILDMVPNHMAAHWDNDWWRDVLEWGQRSPFASYFDIDWQPMNSALRGKVLLPLLEDDLSAVLQAGKLQLRFEAGRFLIAYQAHRFPIAAESYPDLLTAVLEHFDGAEEKKAALHKLVSEFRQCAVAGPSDIYLSLRNCLSEIERQSEGFRSALAAMLDEFNGAAEEPRNHQKIAALLEEQHYRLAFWRSGCEAINYRRFFDITGLVSLRMEVPDVFAATHSLVLRLIDEGKISGLRIDHPDGLADPKRYFERLREHHCPYIVAEKILTGDETLPNDWPVDGTTGYDFLNKVNGLFVESENRERFDEIYSKFIGKERTFAATAYAAKKRVLDKSFVSELNTLADRLFKTTGDQLSFHDVRRALTEIIACFPVYRTYLTKEPTQLSNADRAYIEQVIANARAHAPEIPTPLFDWIKNILLGHGKPSPLSTPHPGPLPVEGRGRNDSYPGTSRSLPYFEEFILKFQQLTGPTAAKGIEDTAFYRYNRLISLNEVGGDPARFGIGVEEFHAFNQGRAQRWPGTLLATATHDTKRGEDVRAAINVLSEIPEEWERAIVRWRELNVAHKQIVSRKPAPDPNDEYFFYQTLVGAWPAPISGATLADFRARATAYMLKAIREAKLHTSWTAPNSEYEAATQSFVEAVLDPMNQPFLDHFAAFQSRIAFFGRLNSLSQLLLKITSPGVPDFYQGSELWDLSLVDPDNRRSVDYRPRQRFLEELHDSKTVHPFHELKRENDLLSPPLSSSEEKREKARFGESDDPRGAAKIWIMRRALRFRQAHRDLFERGNYVPIEVTGPKRRHMCAFARVHESSIALVVVPRLCCTLMNGAPDLPLGTVWEDTRLLLPFELGPFSNVLSGEKFSAKNESGELLIADLFRSVPLALLTNV